MADIDSSLPVRTEAAGDVIAKIADATITSQQLAVEADGSVNANIRASNQDPLTATGTALDVYIQGGSSSGGVSDQSAFAYGVDIETPVGGVFNDTGATLSSGTTGALRLTAERGLHINLRNNAGTEIATAGAPLRIDPTGATAQPVTDNGGSLTVDGAVTVSATDLDIRDLDSTTDSVEVFQAAHDNLNANANLQVGNTDVANGNPVPVSDAGGSLTVDGTVSASNFPATVNTNYGTVGASTIRTAAQIGNATGAADFNAGATGAQTIRVVANQGAANATPWNVNLQPLGTSINDYKAAASIAAGATDNHDYTVTALKTFYLQRVEGSASEVARMRISIESGVATGTFNVVDTKFNSTADQNMEAEFSSPIVVAAGVRVRVAMLNRALLASQDLYSRICGYEV